MGEHLEHEDSHVFSLEEHNERMAQVWTDLEECRRILVGLERRVEELEDARR